MKLKFAVATLACLLPFGPSLGAEKKIDVFGVIAGMPMAQVADVGQDRGWRCKDPQETTFAITLECITKDSQQVDLTFANALPNMPVVRVQVEFKAVGKANVVASLSEQYGPSSAPPSGFWNLANGTTLRLMNEVNERTFYLELINEPLRDANRRAVENRDRASHPTPKF